MAAGPTSSSTRVETLSPTPTTTAPPTRSASTPASFRCPTSRSLGHFSRTSTRAVSDTASATASPTSGDSQPHRTGSTVGRHSTEKVRPARGGDTQVRSSRPRPWSWCSATRTSPPGSPARAAAARSAFVEPVTSTTRISRHGPAGDCSALASATASSGGRLRSSNRAADMRTKVRITPSDRACDGRSTMAATVPEPVVPDLHTTAGKLADLRPSGSRRRRRRAARRPSRRSTPRAR